MDFSKYVKGNRLSVCSELVDINKLIRFLQENKYIIELSLSWCYIDKEGAKALANLTNLTKLDLSHNKIGKEVAEALANLTNLTQLNLTYNKIGKEGVEALANLTNLTELYLAKNNIGNEGAEALTKALNDGKFLKLIEFTFNGNSISTDDKKMLDLAFKRNIERSKQVNNKVVVITSATIAILAISAALVVHFAFQASLLTTGIIAGVGVCCLVAAAIIYYCNSPANLLKDSNAEVVVNQITVV